MASSNLIKQLQERGLVAPGDGRRRRWQSDWRKARSRSIAASILPLTACIWGIWFHCYGLKRFQQAGHKTWLRWSAARPV
nr:Uncharacterised protein [Salmonella sp. NCTC 7297]